MVEEGEDLSELPGIGKDLAGKIKEIVETGELSQLKKLGSKIPVELSNLMKVAGLGPKRVKALYENLGITGLKDLKIEAAKKDRLPELITLDHIRGDLHSHTKASDDRHSLKEMAEAAKNRGYEYLAITEHSKKVRIAHGLDAKRLKKHIKAIDRLNEKLDRIILLKGIEVDILELNAHPDRLDLSDTYCRMAKDMRLKLAISTDAHSTTDLDFMRFGLGQARRGWLEPEDVLNTKSLKQLKKELKRK